MTENQHSWNVLVAWLLDTVRKPVRPLSDVPPVSLMGIWLKMP